MSNTLKKHKCREKCGRLSTKFDNRKINCFGCGDLFHAQCYNLNLDTVLHKQHFKLNSHVQFMCSSCYELLHQFITTQRTDNATASQLAKTNTSNKSCSTDNVTDNTNNNAIAGNHSTRAPSNTDDETLQLHASVKELIAKLSTPPPPTPSVCTISSDFETKIDNIYQLLIRANDKIEGVHTRTEESESIKIVTSLLEKLFKSNDNPNSTKSNNLLDVSKINDWSMHCDQNNDSIGATTGRPSFILQQTIDEDVLGILRNFESRNWDAQDRIMKDLKDQSRKMDTMLSHNNDRIIATSLDHIDDRLSSQSEKLNELLRSANTKSITPIASPLISTILDISSTSSASDDSVLLTGNLPIVDKANIKEAMSQKTTNNNVPETSKNWQKRQMPSLPGGEPGIELTPAELSSSHLVVTPNNLGPSTSNGQNNLHASSSSIIDDIINSSPEELEAQVLDVMSEFDALQSQLPPMIRARRELYLSRFKTHFTDKDIMHYMHQRGIDVTDTRVIRLTKKEQDISLLSFVSFKIETDDDTAVLLKQPDFWPYAISAVDFVQKSHNQRKPVNICSSLHIQPSTPSSLHNVSGNRSNDASSAHDHFLVQRALQRQAD